MDRTPLTEGEKPHVFDESIITNMNEYNKNELVEMTKKWLNIEDDDDVVNDGIEDMIREIECHILFYHTMDQVKCHNGIADLVEDYVEHAHQTGKQFSVFVRKNSYENPASMANK